jgi:hypothetical protein
MLTWDVERSMNLGFFMTMQLTSSNYLLGFPSQLETVIDLLRCTRACLPLHSVASGVSSLCRFRGLPITRICLVITYFHNCASQLRLEENGWSSRSKGVVCCPIHVQINKILMSQPVNFTKYHRPLHQSLKPKILGRLRARCISCH